MAFTDVLSSRGTIKSLQEENNITLIHTHDDKTQTITPIVNNKIQEQVLQKRCSFNETEEMQQVRVRTFSHWQHFTPSSQSMISAGWFSCNVSDRVICIYCNTICHSWTEDDNPIEVHRKLAPTCPFVLSMPLIHNSPKIINDSVNDKFEPAHPTMTEISRREATYSKSNWTEASPSIEDLVRAGFFFTGNANKVTCFYCNGSLHKWGPHDNPMIEHARWFPHCTYIKHLCTDDLYRKIQATKKRKCQQQPISQTELNSLVSARLDLPAVRRLLTLYRLPVIKRCIEDQFRIKNDDFQSDIDLLMACRILQLQIDHIQGCKDKIQVPLQDNKLEKKCSSAKRSLGECLICLTEDKELACMPCGHLCSCVPCGYALKSCPVCRQKIQSFMKISS